MTTPRVSFATLPSTRSQVLTPTDSLGDLNGTIPEESAVRAVLDNLAHLLILPHRLTIMHDVPLGGDAYSGVVLAKLDESTQTRDVAVKQLRTTDIRGNLLRIAMRLARQVKVWDSLRHANVLELQGYYLSPTYHVAQLISPYLRHGNIVEYMQRGTVEVAQRLRFARDITAGLDYLHSRRPPVCHSNLKPSNILIDDNLNAVLSGFGLAKVQGNVSEPVGLTTTQSIKGTPRYMSPELLVEDRAKNTLASDVWAWGCTAFEILTGVQPFTEAQSHLKVFVSIVQRVSPGTPELLLDLVPAAPKPEYASTLRLMHSYLPLCWAFEPRKRPPMSLIRGRVFMFSFEEDAGDSLVATLEELAYLLIPADRLHIVDGSNLGSGTYGEVVLGTLDETKHVAVKKLKTVGTRGDNVRLAKRMARELNVWAKINHPNIVKLVGYCLEENYKAPQLISEYMPNGNVLDYIRRFTPDIEQRVKLVKGITAGLACLHKFDPPICHADLKPDNVLIDLHMNAVLCDFGLASFVSGSPTSPGLVTTTTLKGTPRFMSPELHLEDDPKHTLESDVWAWACTVFQILTGDIPYAKFPSDAAFYLALNQRTLPGDIDMLLPKHFEDVDLESARALEFLYATLPQCWKFNPHNRPSISALHLMLSDPSFQSADVNALGEPVDGWTIYVGSRSLPTSLFKISAHPLGALTFIACLFGLFAMLY